MSSEFAKQVNEDCMAAVESCPQSIQTSNWDACELVGDRSVVVKDLPKRGMKATLAYWSSKDTLGGSTLFESGYEPELSEEVRQALYDYMERE